LAALFSGAGRFSPEAFVDVAGQYSVSELIPSQSRNQKQRRDAEIIPGSARHPVFTAKTQRHEEDKMHHVLARVNLRVFVSLW